MRELAHNENRLTISFLGYSLDTLKVDENFLAQPNVIKIRDAYGIRLETKQAWLFDYAVLVCWDFTSFELEQLIQQLDDVIIAPLKRPSIEHYIYCEDESSEFYIKSDCLFLDNSDDMTKLVLSHALAQSAKLEFLKSKLKR